MSGGIWQYGVPPDVLRHSCMHACMHTHIHIHIHAKILHLNKLQMTTNMFIMINVCVCVCVHLCGGCPHSHL